MTENFDDEIEELKGKQQRELEKQNIEKAHAKTVKQMANQHREQLASIKKESEMARSSLEQKLQKTKSLSQKSQQQQQKSADNNDINPSKPTYQPSLPSTSTGMKTAPRRRYGQKSSQKPPQQVPSVSETSSFNSEYDSEISERMKQFDLAYKMENDSFSKAVDSVEERSLLTAEISKLAIIRAKRRLERLQQQKETLSERLQFLSSRSGKGQQTESITKLQSRISSNYNTISDLKNTNQK